MTEREADPVFCVRALCSFGGEDKRFMVNEDKREFIAQTHDHFGRTAPDLTAQLSQANFRLPAGMTTIEIDPRRRDMDVAVEVQRALEVLQQAGIRAPSGDALLDRLVEIFEIASSFRAGTVHVR